ncbi:hypothetical protein DYB28_012597 [Aphanomyces astaci]|uniref:Uncharacterized protein n=1 Tax=Aphanomyces astaci TaxID=112090 RepID=A0A9X8H4J7_APHAT|nr:hypothetical protein DYB28_012597 [Aphanomyces astaci]
MDEIPLLPSEVYLLRVSSVSSITFYTTTSSDDGNSHDGIRAFLQARLGTITACNPWLQGQLKRSKDGLVLQVEHRNQPLQLGAYDLPQLSPDMPYNDLTTSLEPLAVLRGTELMGNPDQPIFRVAWISISPTVGAFYMSLSHVVADGYTYYRVFNMFGAACTPSALTPRRRPDLPMRTKGYNDTVDLHRSVSMLWHMASTALMSPTPTISVHTLSNEWITREKEAALPTTAVSTNDIVTSWYFQLCRADVGFMVVNTRDKYPHVTHDLAGNYTTLVGYQPQDYASPSLLRASLQSVPYRRAVSGGLPWMFCKSTAMITSWASLSDAAPPALPQCTLVAHFPVADASYNPPYTSLAVVFRKSPAELGIILRTRSPFANASALADATTSSSTRCSVVDQVKNVTFA